MRQKGFLTFATASLLLATAAATQQACVNSKYKRGYERPDTLCIEKAEYRSAETGGARNLEVSVKAEYPSPITGKLSATLAAWVRKNLGGGLPPDTMDARAVVDYYGKTAYHNLLAGGGSLPAAYHAECGVTAMEPRYVSMKLTVTEKAGRATAVKFVTGVTVRRDDGFVFGWKLVGDTASASFRRLMREGVREYLKKTLATGFVGDENLDGQLAGVSREQAGGGVPAESFPVPCTPPFLSPEGLTFVYKPYEIAPFSLGTPVFTVPMEKARHFMTREALKLLETKAGGERENR